METLAYILRLGISETSEDLGPVCICVKMMRMSCELRTILECKNFDVATYGESYSMLTRLCSPYTARCASNTGIASKALS